MSTNFDLIVNSYFKLPLNSSEQADMIDAFLKKYPSHNDRIARANFEGHFTASCLLVDAVKRRILLFQHPIHKNMLQPGGHFDNEAESPIKAATRKLLQETQYKEDEIRYLQYDYDPHIPIDIDTHLIGKTDKEPEHFHHDLRYVFLAVAGEGENREFEAKPTGSTKDYKYKYRWYDLAELFQFQTFKHLIKKLNYFLSIDSARHRFCIGISQIFPIKKRPSRINTIIVTHILPDAKEFLELLKDQTELIGIIPKPNSIDRDVCENLIEMNYPIFETNRENVVDTIVNILNKNPYEKVVLLDIGGWFVPLMKSLPKEYHDRIIGIIEDTKNGERKYLDFAKSFDFPFPIISVAESELKSNEDYLVGKSIAFSADAILRICGLVLDHLECGVIGYGKIGRSIAQHLLKRGIKPIIVETDALRSVRAFREGCMVRHRDWANRNVDVIFCATGNRATGINDFRSLRSGTFIFSVTSSDDEFDFTELKKQYDVSNHPTWSDITVCTGDQNYFYLVNKGNAVNFIHDAVLWEFIQLVKAGIFVSLKNLIEDKEMSSLWPIHQKEFPGTKDKMWGLDYCDQEKIARLWLETVLLGVKLEQ